MHAFLNNLPDCLLIIQFRFLLKKPYGMARRKHRLTVELLVHSPRM